MTTNFSTAGLVYSSVSYERGVIAKVRIILRLVETGVITSSLQLKKNLNIYGIDTGETIVKDVFDKMHKNHISVDDAIVLMGYELNEEVPKTTFIPYSGGTASPFTIPYFTQPPYRVGDVFPPPYTVSADVLVNTSSDTTTFPDNANITNL